MANLATQYLLDIEEQGYALVTCEEAVFKPENCADAPIPEVQFPA